MYSKIFLYPSHPFTAVLEASCSSTVISEVRNTPLPHIAHISPTFLRQCCNTKLHTSSSTARRDVNTAPLSVLNVRARGAARRESEVFAIIYACTRYLCVELMLSRCLVFWSGPPFRVLDAVHHYIYTRTHVCELHTICDSTAQDAHVQHNVVTATQQLGKQHRYDSLGHDGLQLLSHDGLCALCRRRKYTAA